MGKVDPNEAQEGNLYGGRVMNEIAKELLVALKNLHAVCREEGFDNATTGRQILMKDADEAIAKAEAAMAEPQPDADGWIKWDGWECPIDDGVGFFAKLRDKSEHGPDYEANAWQWEWAKSKCDSKWMAMEEHDIIAYRIVKEPQ